VRKVFYILFIVGLLCVGCEFKLRNADLEESEHEVEVERYDRIESRYLTTGDFAALQQMSTGYPMQTRALIEDVLQLGDVNEPNINNTFLKFYQDSLLQEIISDVQVQYAKMDDINEELSKAFGNLKEILPEAETPTIYAQIGALTQSIVVDDKAVGICLDKYLGKDYPIYKRYYTEEQRRQMTREYIVPDCITFYILSLCQIKNIDKLSTFQRDIHIGCIMWVANKTLGKKFFKTRYVDIVEKYMKQENHQSIKELLYTPDFKALEKLK
jgi:hypothetical protein